MPTQASKAPKQEPTAGPAFSQEDTDSMNWVFAWILVIIIMMVITKTQAGYKIVYYSLAAMVLFLMLTQYKWFTKELKLAVFDLPYAPQTDNKGTTTGGKTNNTTYTPGAFGPGGIIPL